MLANIALPTEIVRLAALIGTVLGQGPASGASIDREITDLAVWRHGLELLLYGAARQGSVAPDADALALLEKNYRGNASQQLFASMLLQWLGPRFDKAGVRWLALKGFLQAQQL